MKTHAPRRCTPFCTRPSQNTRSLSRTQPRGNSSNANGPPPPTLGYRGCLLLDGLEQLLQDALLPPTQNSLTSYFSYLFFFFTFESLQFSFSVFTHSTRSVLTVFPFYFLATARFCAPAQIRRTSVPDAQCLFLSIRTTTRPEGPRWRCRGLGEPLKLTIAHSFRVA